MELGVSQALRLQRPPRHSPSPLQAAAATMAFRHPRPLGYLRSRKGPFLEDSATSLTAARDLQAAAEGSDSNILSYWTYPTEPLGLELPYAEPLSDPTPLLKHLSAGAHGPDSPVPDHLIWSMPSMNTQAAPSRRWCGTVCLLKSYPVHSALLFIKTHTCSATTGERFPLYQLLIFSHLFKLLKFMQIFYKPSGFDDCSY